MPAAMFAAAAALATADILIKQSVEENVEEKTERPLLGGRIFLRKVYNRGAALNMLEGRPHMLKALSWGTFTLMLIRLAKLARKRHHVLEKSGITLLAGGAASNMFDRAVRGKVIDYIGFKSRCRALERITYNLGDFFIFAGMCFALAGQINKKEG